MGNIDYGNSNMTMNDEDPVAKEVLVFMVNCVNGWWKRVVGYFFISFMGAVEKINLVESCLNFLNVQVVSFH